MLDELCRFWFGHIDEDGLCDPSRFKFWFQSDSEQDAALRERFEKLFHAAEAGEYDAAADTPRGCLGLVLVFDQLPRNFYRATPRAFATDSRAQKLCLQALDAGQDSALALVERGFLLMPLMHAEDLALQERGVAEFDRLAADTPESRRGFTANFADFARQHRDLIARFGRFPYRNAILGRASTADETAWLESGGETFGQG